MAAHDLHQSPAPVLTVVADHPYVFVLSLILFCCAVTRFRTGISAKYHDPKDESGDIRSVSVVPYWIPFIGHTISFGLGMNEYVQKLSNYIPSGIFALKIAGATHNIIVSPSLTKEILNRPSLPIDNEELVWRFVDLTFGDGGYFKAWNERNQPEFLAAAKVLHNLMREPFLSNAIADTVKGAECGTWNLISGNPSWVDHSGWERAGQVEIISTHDTKGGFVAEADLFGLVRNFVGDIATTVLMGHSFLENNPEFLNDLWLFETKSITLMLGLPMWMTPGVPRAVGARERMITAITEHHMAMAAQMEGDDPGSRYSDLSGISNIIWDRMKAFHDGKCPPRIYGVGDLVVLWAMNVNANQVIFWMLYFIYQDAELLRELRAEISPYVTVRTSDSQLPISEAPKLSIDVVSLYASCPLLKGAMLETMRHEGGANAYRVALDDFVISESKDDAVRMGKARPDKYRIKKGEIISIPAKVQQDSPVFWDTPKRFDARRFWVKKRDEKGIEHISVEYGNLRPWGGGKTACKGRNFAEREVLAFVAAILTVWDIQPVAKNGWKHPGDVFTAGTCVPKKDIRVRMSRREV